MGCCFFNWSACARSTLYLFIRRLVNNNNKYIEIFSNTTTKGLSNLRVKSTSFIPV